MLPKDQKLRTIIEEERFRLELQAIVAHASDADDFVVGVKWALARSPEIGRCIGKGPVWFLPMAIRLNLLPIVLYYTFDEETVNLLSIIETVYPPQE